MRFFMDFFLNSHVKKRLVQIVVNKFKYFLYQSKTIFSLICIFYKLSFCHEKISCFIHILNHFPLC